MQLYFSYAYSYCDFIKHYLIAMTIGFKKIGIHILENGFN
jgi:hypothetical protein